MKIVFLTLLLIFTAHAENILIIGDSHMAGPFGRNLITNFKETNHNVAVYGHASSSAKDWIYEEGRKLRGGVYQAALVGGYLYKNPTPTDWREYVLVPFFNKLSENMLLHRQWGRNSFALKYNVVVFELGANDRRSITSDTGVILHAGWNYRLKKNKELIQRATSSAQKCLWIYSPHGDKKTDIAMKNLYKFLDEVTDGNCEVMSSIHYKAKYIAGKCDGVHFNSCPEDLIKAKKWARESFEFIVENL